MPLMASSGHPWTTHCTLAACRGGSARELVDAPSWAGPADLPPDDPGRRGV